MHTREVNIPYFANFSWQGIGKVHLVTEDFRPCSIPFIESRKFWRHTLQCIALPLIKLINGV